ncbi:hypothetical protein Tco_1560023 [Tanacetum coccineum]
MMKETSYELLKDNQKKQLDKNNEANMTFYNALPRKEYERVFMCKTIKEVWHTLIITHQENSQVKNYKIDLLTKEYEKFLISNEETIDSGFTGFGVIVTSLKSLDPDYSSKNHVKKFLRALPMKWRAKVLPIALKANVTRGQTSNDSVCQDGSDEDEDEEEEFNLIVRNLWKLFKKGNRFRRENLFGNGGDRFDRGRGGRSKGVGSSRRERSCYGCSSKNHFVDDFSRAKVKKAFIGGFLSDSKDGDKIKKDATCLMAIGLQKVNLNPSHFDNNVNELLPPSHIKCPRWNL